MNLDNSSHSLVLPRNPRAPEYLTLGLAASYTDGQPSASRDLLHYLQTVIVQQQLVASRQKSRQAAARDARSALLQVQRIDPDLFPAWIGIYDEGAIRGWAVTVTRGVLAATVAAGATWLTGPGAPAVLAGLGTMMDDRLVVPLANGLVDAALPRASDDQVLALTHLAAAKYYELAADSADAERLGLELHRSGLLLPNPQRSVQDAADALPPRQKALGQLAARGERDRRTVEAEVHSQCVDALSNANQQLEEYQRRLRQEHAAASREAAALNIYHRTHYLTQEMLGVAALGEAFLANVFNDPAAARAVGTTIRSASQILLTVATPGIGPFAAAGSIAQSAIGMFGAIGSSNPLVEALAPIHAKLDVVILRLGVVETQQRRMIEQLQHALLALAENQALLREVMDEVTTLARTQAENAAEMAQQDLSNAITQLSSLLVNSSPRAIAASDVLRNSYGRDVATVFRHAAVNARGSALAGNFNAARTKQQWASYIRANPRADRLVGVLPSALAELGQPLPSALDAQARTPVSPIEWSRSVNVYLEARGRVSNLQRPSDTNELMRLWADGLYVKKLIEAIASAESLEGLRIKLRTAAGLDGHSNQLDRTTIAASSTLVGQLFRAARESDTAVVRRTVRVLPSQHGAPGWVIRDRTHVVRFEPDFFNYLLRTGAITAQRCTRYGNNNYRHCYYRVTQDGPRNGELLVPGRITRRNADTEAYFPDCEGKAESYVYQPFRLQEAARDIVLERQDRGRFLIDLQRRLTAEFVPQDSEELAFWAEVSRMACTLIYWRAAFEEDTTNALLANAVGAFSGPQIVTFIASSAPELLTATGYWPVEIAQAVGVVIDKTFENMKVLAAMVSPSRSLPTLDETLRRLGGFILVNGGSLSANFP